MTDKLNLSVRIPQDSINTPRLKLDPQLIQIRNGFIIMSVCVEMVLSLVYKTQFSVYMIFCQSKIPALSILPFT